MARDCVMACDDGGVLWRAVKAAGIGAASQQWMAATGFLLVEGRLPCIEERQRRAVAQVEQGVWMQLAVLELEQEGHSTATGEFGKSGKRDEARWRGGVVHDTQVAVSTDVVRRRDTPDESWSELRLLTPPPEYGHHLPRHRQESSEP